MRKHLRLFNTASQFEDYVADGELAYPLVSYSESDNVVHYGIPMDSLRVAYNVTDTTVPTTLIISLDNVYDWMHVGDAFKLDDEYYHLNSEPIAKEEITFNQE